MKAPPGAVVHALRKVCLVAGLVSGAADAQTPSAAPAQALPPMPFEARIAREAPMFRKKKLDEDDVRLSSAGHIVTVSELAPEQTWKGETAPVAVVHPHAQATYYMLLPSLQPLSPGEVMTDEEAAALLFPASLGASRAWCQRYAERLLLPASANAGKGAVLLYSASSDTACAGYMALATGTGAEAQARPLPRYGALQSVTVREVPGSPPLVDLVESIVGKDLSGRRRRWLSLGSSGTQELLAVELEQQQLNKGVQHRIQSQVSLKPAGKGLDIEVARTEQQVSLSTGVASGTKTRQKRYHYEAGKLLSKP